MSVRPLAPVLLTLLLSAACGGDDSSGDATGKVVEGEAQAAVEPRRTAAKDEDLRHLVALLVSSESCSHLQNLFYGLDSDDLGDEAITGSLWVEQCKGSSKGKRVRMTARGRGWRYVHRKKDKAGADFELSQYVRFSIDASLSGIVDIAYATQKKVVTMWITPDTPDIEVETLGEVDVDGEGLWADVVGTAASAIGQGPDEKGSDKVESRSKEKIEKRLDKGITVSMDLCGGDVDASFGHQKAGEMNHSSSTRSGKKKDTGAKHTRVRLMDKGLIIVGPETVNKKSNVEVSIEGDAKVRVRMLCEEQAVALASAYLEDRDRPADLPAMIEEKVTGEATLKIEGDLACRSAYLVFESAPDVSGPVEMSYELSPNLHTPLIDCD